MKDNQNTTKHEAPPELGGSDSRRLLAMPLQPWEDDYEPDAYDEWEQGCIDYDQQEEY